MIDLKYKAYTNKDYLVDEVSAEMNVITIDKKELKKDLRKLKNDTLLELLSNLNN
tara:strand:+ start:2163 stop:2327 length:165 start_codon:yes stop_codon:yes gene_type:complete